MPKIGEIGLKKLVKTYPIVEHVMKFCKNHIHQQSELCHQCAGYLDSIIWIIKRTENLDGDINLISEDISFFKFGIKVYRTWLDNCTWRKEWKELELFEQFINTIK